jgi:hypothetical protein
MKDKKPPGSLYHLSHGQREPGGSHSLVPEDKFNPSPTEASWTPHS